MNSAMLRPLMEGHYLCPVRFPNEYELLLDVSEREAVDTWLRPLGYRLSRLGDEGAFFVSPVVIGAKEAKQVRDELIAFRDSYGPYVELLNFIRQAKPESAALGPGTVVQLVELDLAVRDSGTLEAQLRSLIRVIHAGAERLTNRENLKKLCEHLVKDGYMVVKDRQTEVYVVTGKIEQLDAVLLYLDENKAIPDDEVDDQLKGVQADLLTPADAVKGVHGEGAAS